jgi:hypothetical protein
VRRRSTVLVGRTKGRECSKVEHEGPTYRPRINSSSTKSTELGDTVITPGGSPNVTEAATPALDIAPPASSSLDQEDPRRPLPEFGLPTSPPPLPPSLEGAYSTPARSHQPPVVSTPSAQSPFVYMANSGVNGLITSSAGEENA